MFDFVEFGEFVRTLRKRERITQEELAEHLNHAVDDAAVGSINKDHISRIERGKVGIVALQKYIEALAACFRLTEAEKNVFYAKANIIYKGSSKETPTQDNRHNIIRKEIERIFTHIRYPCFARTRLWDILAFNTYLCEVFGYDDEKRKILQTPPLQSNLLRILFDDRFHNADYIGGDVKWRENAMRSLRAFRRESFRFVGTPRYNVIMNEMNKNRRFRAYWELSMDDDEASSAKVARPEAQVYHPIGIINFWSLRTAPKFLGADIDISVYVPVDTKQDTYQKLQSTIQGGNQTYFFDEAFRTL